MAAASMAVAEAALPVEALVTRSRPISRARTKAMALARSLNEALGFRPSSLMNRERSPSGAASRSARNNGVQPIGGDSILVATG